MYKFCSRFKSFTFAKIVFLIILSNFGSTSLIACDRSVFDEQKDHIEAILNLVFANIDYDSHAEYDLDLTIKLGTMDVDVSSNYAAFFLPRASMLLGMPNSMADEFADILYGQSEKKARKALLKFFSNWEVYRYSHEDASGIKFVIFNKKTGAVIYLANMMHLIFLPSRPLQTSESKDSGSSPAL